MEDNRQWLTDGNCTKCRRKEYCSKRCTKNKQKGMMIARQIVEDKMGVGILNTLMGKGYGR